VYCPYSCLPPARREVCRGHRCQLTSDLEECSPKYRTSRIRNMPTTLHTEFLWLFEVFYISILVVVLKRQLTVSISFLCFQDSCQLLTSYGMITRVQFMAKARNFLLVTMYGLAVESIQCPSQRVSFPECEGGFYIDSYVQSTTYQILF
jgi:hypothetical protein